MFDSPGDEALRLAQSAMVQQAIGRSGQARLLLDKARELSAGPRVLLLAAGFAASERRWGDVLGDARSVLKINPWSGQAR